MINNKLLYNDKQIINYYIMINEDYKKKGLTFIHANGFPPISYNTILDELSKTYNVDNFLLRPLWSKKTDPKKLKDWNVFCEDYEVFLNNYKDKVIGLGHSIGGNIVLHTAIKNPKLFSKIILLDPTLFPPKIILMWKIINLFKLQHYFLDLSKNTKNKTMFYDSIDQMFQNYRKKAIFQNINDEILTNYIKSITKKGNGEIRITYSNNWEEQIYNKGLLKDNYIWKNIKNLSIPCLIIHVQNSNAFPQSSIEKIKKINKNIQFKSLDNLTHLFPLENPEITTKLINQFIEKSD